MNEEAENARMRAWIKAHSEGTCLHQEGECPFCAQDKQLREEQKLLDGGLVADSAGSYLDMIGGEE